MIIFIVGILISLGFAYFLNPAFLVGTLIIWMIWMIVFYNYRAGHIADHFEVQKLKKQRTIRQKIADDLIPRFTVVLQDTFPKLEAEIFNNISSQDVDIFVTKFPEIKSDKTLMELVSLINRKVSEVYDCDLRAERIIARINERKFDALAWLPVKLPNLD